MPSSTMIRIMQYKALMLDIDGTLVRFIKDARPTERVKQAVHAAQQFISVGVATSRPYFFAKKTIADLHLHGPSIFNSGAQIVDPATDTVLFEQCMEEEDVKRILQLLKTCKIAYLINDAGRDVKDITDYTPEKPYNFYFSDISQTLNDELITKLSHISTIAIHNMPAWDTGRLRITISHAKATKQYGILKVAETLGLTTHEIIGVGDGANDFPLLMACGFKVAMGNAGDDLKAIADYIAPSVDADGVADVIEKFILPQGTL